MTKAYSFDCSKKPTQHCEYEEASTDDTEEEDKELEVDSQDFTNNPVDCVVFSNNSEPDGNYSSNN